MIYHIYFISYFVMVVFTKNVLYLSVIHCGKPNITLYVFGVFFTWRTPWTNLKIWWSSKTNSRTSKDEWKMRFKLVFLLEGVFSPLHFSKDLWQGTLLPDCALLHWWVLPLEHARASMLHRTTKFQTLRAPSKTTSPPWKEGANNCGKKSNIS